MIFNPKTGQLFKNDGTFLKSVDCPYAMTPEQLVTIHGSVEGKHCRICKSTVHRLDGMTDDQVEQLVAGKSKVCVFATPEAKNVVFLKEYRSFKQHDHTVPVIRTLRSLPAMMAAQELGFKVLIKKSGEPPKEGESQVQVYQHRETGRIWVAYDLRSEGPVQMADMFQAMEGKTEQECAEIEAQYDREREAWEVVVPWVFIRSDKTFPVAGYVIPPDLPNETEVWVEDVAEEIFTVFWSQGTSERTVSSYATWRDGDLVFPPPPEQPYITG